MARERFLLDGWELTEGTVRDWAYRGGTDSATAPVGANASVANRAGEIWRPKAAGAGQFSLDVWVTGADRSEVEDNWRLLLRAARRRHRLIPVTRYMASGEVVTCDAELVGTIDPTHIGQRGMRASLSFSVPSGLWVSQASFVASTTPGAALPQTLALPGLEPSTEAMVDLTYVINGPITNPVIVDRTDGYDGDSFKYNGTVSASQSLTVNAGTWLVTGGGGLTVDHAKVMPSGNRLMTVVAARPDETPTVQLRGTGGGGGTKLTVTGRRSYAC